MESWVDRGVLRGLLHYSEMRDVGTSVITIGENQGQPKSEVDMQGLPPLTGARIRLNIVWCGISTG
jgi:hypothetical protein